MSCEIIQFSTAARVSAKRREKIQTSTRVGEDIGDDFPTGPILNRRERPLPEPLTETCKNQRLRDQRKAAWNRARHTTDYWHASLKWSHALSCAQSNGIQEALEYDKVDYSDSHALVDKWREALAKQILTNAPDQLAVLWKKAQLRSGDTQRAGLKPEHVELVIARDLEFLDAHPTRKPSKKGGGK